MLTKKIVYIAGLFLGLGLLIANPILAQGPFEAPTATVSGVFFTASVQVTPLDRAADYIQDIRGTVVSADGKGIEGITVKANSPGWQATDVTKGGGAFKFTLTKGEFVVQLDGVRSQEAKFVVDGKSDVVVRFVDSSGQTPTVQAATPTSTVTATPTTTNTPVATKTIVVTASTPSSSGSVATVTPTPSNVSQIRRSSDDLSIEGWQNTFVAGAGLGFLVMIMGVSLAIVRRRRG